MSLSLLRRLRREDSAEEEAEEEEEEEEELEEGVEEAAMAAAEGWKKEFDLISNLVCSCLGSYCVLC